MAKKKIVLRGRILVIFCNLPQEPLFGRCCTSSSLFFIFTLGLLIHREAADQTKVRGGKSGVGSKPLEVDGFSFPRHTALLSII
jgi:hypothetical protein